MANRMVLIPQEVYDSLVSPRQQDPVEERLQENTTRLHDVLHSKGKSSSEKYIQYDQKIKQIRDLMAQKEERSGSGLELILDRLLSKYNRPPPSTNTFGAQTSEVKVEAPPPPPPPPPQVPTVQTTSTEKQVPPVEEKVPTPSTRDQRSRSAAADKKSQRKRDVSLPVKSERNTTMDYETSDAPDFEMSDSTAFDRVRSIIMRDRARYGVNEDGMVLRKGRTPYYHSNVDDVLRYLLGDTTGESPPGTNALRGRLMEDPEIAHIMSRPRAERPSTRDLMDKYSHISEKPPPGRMKIETPKFRPALWDPRKVKEEIIDNEQEGERSTSKELIRKYNKPKKQSVPFKRPTWKKH
ncbi:hypothetical protein AAVH_08892 [Aphelenchoides avenae]|nr:hypothetical protein AAVH_08892 [Aphelenchus avenae]